MPDPTVVEDISSMFDALGGGVTEIIDPTPEPIVAEPAVEQGETLAPAVEPVTTDPTPAVVIEPVVVTPEPVVVAPVVSVEDTLRGEIARMAGLLAQQGITGSAPIAFPVPTPAAPVTGELAPTAVAPVTPANYLAALQALLSGELLNVEELDQVIDKPELLNAAYKRSNKTLVENLFAALPEIISGEVAKSVQVNKLVTTFYELNPDLKQYADFVRLTMDAQEKANPQKTYREIFTETATQCRQRLGLKEPTAVTQTGSPVGKPLPPAFAGSKTTSGRPSGALSTKEAFDPDLDAMFRLT